MSRQIAFNGVDEALKADLEAQWAEKLSRLRKLLRPYAADLREIRLTISRHQEAGQSPWYFAQATVDLPTGTVAAEASDEKPQAALDGAADLLVAKVKEHKDRVRTDHLSKRKSGRAAVNSAVPRLQQAFERGSQQEFFQLLRPLLGFLHEHVRRELRILELEGVLHRGEVTVADLMDEVLVRAWDGFQVRPGRVPLDLWLTDLLHRALKELAAQEARPHDTLEQEMDRASPEEVPPVEARQEKEEKEWWDEMDPFEQTILLEDVVPEPDSREPWQDIDPNELRDRLLSLINALPWEQRQALLLNVLEGYEISEIAKLLNRSESEVKADIEAARRSLRERLQDRQEMRDAATIAARAPAAPDTKR